MTLNISPVSFGSRKLPNHRINTAKIADSAARTVEDTKLKQQSADVKQEITVRRAAANINIKQWMKNFFTKYMCENAPEQEQDYAVDLNARAIDTFLSQE